MGEIGESRKPTQDEIVDAAMRASSLGFANLCLRCLGGFNGEDCRNCNAGTTDAEDMIWDFVEAVEECDADAFSDRLSELCAQAYTQFGRS